MEFGIFSMAMSASGIVGKAFLTRDTVGAVSWLAWWTDGIVVTGINLWHGFNMGGRIISIIGRQHCYCSHW